MVRLNNLAKYVSLHKKSELIHHASFIHFRSKIKYPLTTSKTFESSEKFSRLIYWNFDQLMLLALIKTSHPQ